MSGREGIGARSGEDEKFALSLGASTFIRKPTEPDVLVQILNEVFEKAKSGLLAPPKVAPLEPSLYLTEYNKRLAAKLGQKVAQLEVAEGKLRHANSVLRAIRGINTFAQGALGKLKGPFYFLLFSSQDT